MAIVTNAAAGPLNLGRLVIRAQININPQTATLTITTDPLPQIALGIPLHIQRVSLNLNRPHFIINPTSCDEQQILATISSVIATQITANSRYALADCESLAFKPTLTASTVARTSLANRASLDIKLNLHHAEPGTDANLARLKIALPRQLSTRLTSLQHACRAVLFDTNPAQCPTASIVGIARANTPITDREMQGPVYIVSQGHDVLPTPVILLQGDGITLELSGTTTINNTRSNHVAFNNIPDIPLENTEIFLPRGPNSLLATNTSLCIPGRLITVTRSITRKTRRRAFPHIVMKRERLRATLSLPTELAAHNGAIARQTTQVTVTG